MAPCRLPTPPGKPWPWIPLTMSAMTRPSLPPFPRLRGGMALRRAIPGDAANRSRRLRAAGREQAKVEEEQRRREATGPEVSAEIWDALGVALLAQGRPKEAEEAFRRALTTTTATEAKAANDSFDAEWAANNLAVALKAQGSERFGEAEQLYRETLRQRRERSGPGFSGPSPSPETLTSLNNLAVLLKAEGQVSEAEALYREALQGRRKVLGNLHPDTLTSINNLATLLSSTGRTTEAENLYQEDTLFSADNLGALLFREGRPAEAEVYFRRAQQGLARQLGVFDPESLRSKDNLAVTLMALQRLDEAEPLLKEAVEGFRQVLGEDHPDTLVAQANLFALMEEIEERDADTLSRTA